MKSLPSGLLYLLIFLILFIPIFFVSCDDDPKVTEPVDGGDDYPGLINLIYPPDNSTGQSITPYLYWEDAKNRLWEPGMDTYYYVNIRKAGTPGYERVHA